MSVIGSFHCIPCLLNCCNYLSFRPSGQYFTTVNENSRLVHKSWFDLINSTLINCSVVVLSTDLTNILAHVVSLCVCVLFLWYLCLFPLWFNWFLVARCVFHCFAVAASLRQSGSVSLLSRFGKWNHKILNHNLATNTPPWLCDCGFCVFVFVQKLKLIFNPTLPTFQFSLVQLNVVRPGSSESSGIAKCSPHMQSTFKQATKLNYSLQIVDI